MEGGEGCVSGGRSERSSERFGEWRRVGEVAPVGGVDISIAMVDIHETAMKDEGRVADGLLSQCCLLARRTDGKQMHRCM